MNLFQVSILGAFPTTVALGLVVFLNRVQRRANQAFFFLSATMTVWLACLWMASFADSVEQAVFWIRQSSASSAVLPFAINLLRLVSRPRRQSWSAILWRSKTWLLILIGIIALCQTRFFLRNAILPTDPMDIALPVYGPGFIVFTAFYILSLITLVGLFIRDHRTAFGIWRVELGFIILACTCAVFFGILFMVVANATDYHEIGQLLPLAAILFNVIIAYGLATRQILHVTHVIRRFAASMVMVLYLSVIYAVAWFGTSWILRHFVATRLPLAHAAAAIVVAMSLTPVKWRLRKVVDNLFPDDYSPDLSQSIRDAGRILNTISTVSDLLQRFAKLISEALQSESVRIFLGDRDGLMQQHAYPETEQTPLKILEDDPLMKALTTQDFPIVREMVQRMRPHDSLIRAEKRMSALGVDAVAGIRSSGKITGAILLGPRTSGTVYGSIEQSVLTGLCDQLAVALENAKLYTEVRNSRIYNDLLLDYLVNGVIATDMQRKITVCNREAARILRVDPDRLQRRHVNVLPQSLVEILNQTFANETEIRDRQVTLPGDEITEETPLNAGSALVCGHTGEPLGALLVFNDLTAVRKLERQVRRTDRLASLGTLAAGMAHEIKNPLVTVKTFTQLLPERFEDEDFRGSFTELVGNEIERIDTLVNQLLHFSRPSEPSLHPVRVHPLIQNTLKLVGQAMKLKRITVKSHFEASRDVILGDANLLVQALVNFLLNAIECMGSDGVVTLGTRSSAGPLPGQPTSGQAGEGHLLVTVADTGPGIPAEHLQHVFDPFYTTKVDGTGLGLSVAHDIIQKHHGSVDVESVPGQGSVFFMYFPLISNKEPKQ